MTVINTNISIITLNNTGFNSQNPKHRLDEQIKEQGLLCCLQKTQLQRWVQYQSEAIENKL